MASLVDDPHQALGEVGLIIAGGDAHITGYAATEGVHAYILTPAIEIKAQQLHHLLAQFGLFGGRKGALWLDEGLLFLFLANLGDQAGEPPFEFAEQGVEMGAVHPWLVELKQTVVGT